MLKRIFGWIGIAGLIFASVLVPRVAAGASTAIAVVTGHGSGTATTGSLTIPSCTCSGRNGIIVVVSSYSDDGFNEVSSVTDTKGDSFSLGVQTAADSYGDVESIYYVKSALAGTDTISVTATAQGDGTDYVIVTAYQVPTLLNISSTDTNSGTTESITTGSATISSNQFLVAGVTQEQDQTLTAGSSWGDFETYSPSGGITGGAEDYDSTGSGSLNGTFSSNSTDTWESALVDFNESA